jgi:hypothetical protein
VTETRANDRAIESSILSGAWAFLSARSKEIQAYPGRKRTKMNEDRNLRRGDSSREVSSCCWLAL